MVKQFWKTKRNGYVVFGLIFRKLNLKRYEKNIVVSYWLESYSWLKFVFEGKATPR